MQTERKSKVKRSQRQINLWDARIPHYVWGSLSGFFCNYYLCRDVYHLSNLPVSVEI